MRAPALSAVTQIKLLIENLNFRSESDDVWQMFVPEARRVDPLDCSVMTSLTGRACVGTQDFDSFMLHNSNPNVQPQAKRYASLHRAMAALLTTRIVFRMGPLDDEHFNLHIYVVGIDQQKNLVGISVGATET